MNAEILSTGDEVLRGEILDGNAAHIAEQLESIGLNVVRHNCVGDDLDSLISVIQEIASRTDIAIVTGGLGPTRDDLTAEAMAKAAGVEIYLDDAALNSIEQFLKALRLPVSDTNRKQAWLPKTAKCLFNPVGTAPGFKIKINQCHFYCLPGVPAEMTYMLSKTVLPDVLKHMGASLSPNRHKHFSVFGLPESEVAEKLTGFEAQFPEIKLGLCAEFPEIHVNISARHEDESYLEICLQNAAVWIQNQIGDWIFTTNDESMEAVIGRLLKEKKATLAIAESCTGGLIAHRVTNVPGSSDYFLFSGVTYSNSAKTNVLGVSESTLQNFGAVDIHTVLEMAEGAQNLSGATYALATSGIAGPSGGTPGKPVGTICIAVVGPKTSTTRQFTYPLKDRSKNKTLFAMIALEVLRRELLKA